MMELDVDALVCFQTIIYKTNRSDLLPTIGAVAEEYVLKARENQKDFPFEETYPVLHTGNFIDERTQDFRQFICDTAYSVLHSQGVPMDGMSVNLLDMWLQNHYKYSLMEQHVHGYGSQISGFYFIEVPENSCQIVFHDPRPGKTQISLNQNISSVEAYNYSSNALFFTPEPGMLLFTNSWLPHALTRNRSDSPVKFIHFDLGMEKRIIPKCEPIII